MLPRLRRMMPLAQQGWHPMMGGVGIHMWDWTGSILPHSIICLRPSVYCISSPVYSWRVIGTGVYSKQAFIQGIMVLLYFLIIKKPSFIRRLSIDYNQIIKKHGLCG